MKVPHQYSSVFICHLIELLAATCDDLLTCHDPLTCGDLLTCDAPLTCGDR